MKTDTRGQMATQDVVESLLRIIRNRLYADNAPNFHQDRKRLIHALTWTANWMEQRGLATSPRAYYTLLSQRIAEVAEHGEPGKYAQYLPAYLLKCIQQHIRHNAEEIYDTFKRIRNFIETVELKTQSKDQAAAKQRRFIKEMQHLHKIAAPIMKAKADRHQMKLW